MPDSAEITAFGKNWLEYERRLQMVLPYSIVLHSPPRNSRLFCPRCTRRLLSVSDSLHKAEFGEVTKRLNRVQIIYNGGPLLTSSSFSLTINQSLLSLILPIIHNTTPSIINR